jgi:hypothetical protein
MADVTPQVTTLAAVYRTYGTVGALVNEAMSEVDMTAFGYPLHTVYEITSAANRYLTRAVVPVFEADVAGNGVFSTITGTIEYAGGRIILPVGSARGINDVVRMASGSAYTTIRKCFGASVAKMNNGSSLVDVTLLGDAYVNRFPTLKDFSFDVDAFMVYNQAEVTSTKGAANGNLIFQHKPGGTAGNGATVTITDPGGAGALTITGVGDDITITLKHAGGAQPTSTALEVMAAFNDSPYTKAYGLQAVLPSGSTGAGLMDGDETLTLAGGADADDYEGLLGIPLVVMLYASTSSDIRMEGFAYLETSDWTFDPANVVQETLSFKGDGPLYYRPA